ncbi:M56 family metallopeptidase [Spirosoma koreense]
MNTLRFLTNPVAEALGWTLLHTIWQGFAVVVPVAVLLHILQHRSSVLRYRVGVLALLVQLLASTATFIWYYEPTVKALPLSAVLKSAEVMPIRWQTFAQTLPWHQQVQYFLEAHLSQFVLTYLIGVALFGLRLVGGWVYLQRLRQTALRPTTVAWTHLTDKLRSSLHIRAVVEVRESARIAVPMVVGVLKPMLLLPISLATHLTIREIEAVLAHELAHVKRQDYAVNLLQSVVEVLYFFHPALWWLSARVREEREHCCDDLAVQVCGGDGYILAQALARVEELRLVQNGPTPVLAMAFASKRQHLLHRVRRMLGVPTQPFVSNGSLAGLTLATILLMSASVYAMQEEKPKPPASQPHPSHTSRRHRTGNGTEFTITDSKKVDHIIWKGQKLPARRVAHLQQLLDQVMAGKVSLDTVPKSDRDILLTIIETNSSFEASMKGLAEGLTHIDYSNIVASALQNVPLSPDGTVEGLTKVDYSGIIHDAMASLSTVLPLTDSLGQLRTYHQRQIDSLSQLMAQQSKQAEALRLQMEKLRFPIEEVNRNSDVLQWRKNKLLQQREALIENHQRLLANEGKQKLSQAEIEKQLAALEPEIKKLEGSMEDLNRQFEQINARQDELKQPMQKLGRESEQLDAQLEKLSEEMEKHGAELELTVPDLSNLDVDVNVNTDVRRPRRPAKSPVAPKAVTPAIAPMVPDVTAPVPARPSPRVNVEIPAAPPAPSAAPKPALAPFSEQPDIPNKPARKAKRSN